MHSYSNKSYPNTCESHSFQLSLFGLFSTFGHGGSCGPSFEQYTFPPLLFPSVHLQFILRVYFNFSLYYTNLLIFNYFQLIYFFSMFLLLLIFCSFTLLPTSSLHRLIWAISYRFAVTFYQHKYLGWNFDKLHTHKHTPQHFSFFYPERFGHVCAMWFVILPFTYVRDMFCIYIFLVHCWTTYI